MRTYGVYSEGLCSYFTAQMLDGLEYLHRNGVVHRDIKSANILLNKTGSVVIGDFGLAMEIYAGSTAHLVGTPHWMPPEAIEDNRWHFNSDIWSLGCTIIELMTGHPPNGSANKYTAMYRACQQPVDVTMPSGISKQGCDFLLANCFVKDPERRATAGSLLAHPWIVQRVKLESMTKLYTSDNAPSSMASSMRRADESHLRSELPSILTNEMLCPVLGRPMHDALSLAPCGHSMSDEAFNRCINMHAQGCCVVCKTAIESTAPNHFIRRFVGNSK